MGLVCLFPEKLGASGNATLHNTILSLCAPIVVFIAVVIFLAIKGCMHQREIGWKKIRYQVLFSIIFILYFSFFNASTLVISTFNCIQDSSGNYYLEPHPWLECEGFEYHKLVILASAGAVVFIVIPLVTFTFLLWKYSDCLETPEVRPWLGYLYICYEPKDGINIDASFRRKVWCYAEVVFMLLRLALAASIAIPHNSSIWKKVGILIVLLIILAYFTFLKPYSRQLENALACVSIMVLICTFLSAIQLDAMWTDGQYSLDQHDEQTLRFFVFVINAIVITAFSAGIIHQTKEELLRNLRTFKQHMTRLCIKFKQRVCGRYNDNGEQNLLINNN